MISGASDTLRQWLEMGSLSAVQYQAAVEQVGQRPKASHWWAFFQITTFVLAAGALVFSLLFFIAFNWADMSHMTKFALVEGSLVLAVLGYLYRVKVKQDDGAIVGWCLLGISLLIGGLLALFGQVYQTGADSWQLFFSWALLVTPLTLVARFMPLWCVWLLLVNVTMLLLYDQRRSGIYSADIWMWFSFHLLINTVLLVIWQWLRDKTFAIKLSAIKLFAIKLFAIKQGNHIVSRVLVLVCLMVLGFYWSDHGWKYNSAAFLLPVWLAATMVYYRFRVLDVFILGVCLVMLALYLTYLVQTYWFVVDIWAISWLLNAVILLGIGSFGTHWLRHLANKIDGEADSELDGEINSEVNSEINSSANKIKQVSENPNLWQQLINLGLIAADSHQPKSALHGVMNITAMFSLLSIGAGGFFIFILFTVFPVFAEETTFQIIGAGVSLVACWLLSRQVYAQAIFYLPTVFMLILAVIFTGLLLSQLAVSEKIMMLTCAVGSSLCMVFLKLKSLRFMLLVMGGCGILRLGHLFDVEVLVIVLMSFAWLYLVFNESHLFERFGVATVIPLSHGLLVMLLIASVVGQQQYRLFGTNAQTLAAQLPFVVLSLCLLIALIYCIYCIAKRAGVEAFKPFIVAGFLLVVLLFSVPLVSLSLCIMLGGFYLQRRGWLMIGSLSLLYFLGLFYYDLETTLDAKALHLALFGLGVIVLRYVVKINIKELSQNQIEAQS